MSQPVGDLVIDLSLDAVRFDEQMSRVRRHFSGLDTDARKTASAVEQGLSRQALAAQKAGISVGQYKAAMRTLPAQFTDIATQLAGGQNPWLILLQQGGQVKDSFGGMIPMFRGVYFPAQPSSYPGRFLTDFRLKRTAAQAFSISAASLNNFSAIWRSWISDALRYRWARGRAVCFCPAA